MSRLALLCVALLVVSCSAAPTPRAAKSDAPIEVSVTGPLAATPELELCLAWRGHHGREAYSLSFLYKGDERLRLESIALELDGGTVVLDAPATVPCMKYLVDSFQPTEMIGVEVDAALLERIAAAGADVRLVGDEGSIQSSLDARARSLVRGLFDEIDDARRKHPEALSH